MAVESDRKDAISVEKMFLKGDKASSGVSKDFHILDH